MNLLTAFCFDSEATIMECIPGTHFFDSDWNTVFYCELPDSKISTQKKQKKTATLQKIRYMAFTIRR